VRLCRSHFVVTRTLYPPFFVSYVLFIKAIFGGFQAIFSG
jgi:hypothetical protein